MSKSTMFHFSPFANSTWTILSFLSLGLEGHGSIAVCASKHGLKLKIAGEVVARGTEQTRCAPTSIVIWNSGVQ